MDDFAAWIVIPISLCLSLRAVFQYVSSQHNVYEVSESTYRSCDTAGGTNGVRVKYTSGYDRVLLAEARAYWFLCDFPGHCLGGMKLAVNVSAGGGPSPGVPQPPVDGNGNNAASLVGEGRQGWVALGLALLSVLLCWWDCPSFDTWQWYNTTIWCSFSWQFSFCEHLRRQ